MIFEKIQNLFKLGLKDAYIKTGKVYADAEAKISKEFREQGKNGVSESTTSEFIKARSSYKQWYRMFNSPSIDGRTVSKESKAFIDLIKKTNFDITKLGNNISEGLKLTINAMTDLKKESPMECENSIIQIFFDTVDILLDKQLLHRVQTWNKILTITTKDGLIIDKNKEADEKMEKLYRYSFLVNSYVSLIFFVNHLSIQFSSIYPTIPDEPKSRVFVFLENYIRSYRFFYYQVALKLVPVIVYFKKIDLKKLDKALSVNYAESIEDFKKNQPWLYNSREDLTLGIIITIGVVLGLMTILPLVRGIIYYFSALKIDIANYYKDEAIYFSFNIKKLKEQRANTTDEKEIERLDKIIMKQEAEVEKLEKLAIKFGIEYEEITRQVETYAENDTIVEDEEFNNSQQPTILI